MGISCITETKKNEKRVIKMRGGNILLFSEVQRNKNSKAEVGCIISAVLTNSIEKLQNKKIIIENIIGKHGESVKKY